MGVLFHPRVCRRGQSPALPSNKAQDQNRPPSGESGKLATQPVGSRGVAFPLLPRHTLFSPHSGSGQPQSHGPLECRLVPTNLVRPTCPRDDPGLGCPSSPAVGLAPFPASLGPGRSGPARGALPASAPSTRGTLGLGTDRAGDLVPGDALGVLPERHSPSSGPLLRRVRWLSDRAGGTLSQP